MDFGKVDPSQLDQIDFTLPPDKAVTTEVLAASKSKEPKAFVGCAKWGRSEWLGKLYPKGTKSSEYLDHYVNHYNAIELNATFYRIFPENTVAKWAEKADGKDFLFYPKFPGMISHQQRLKNAEGITDEFFRSMSALGEHLGPFFLQLHGNFSQKNHDVLANYLEHLPKDQKVFLEIRSKKWFEDEEAYNKLTDLLRKENVGFIITDTAGLRYCAHMGLTTPEAFIRFVGNSLHPTDRTRIDDWVQRIKQWFDQGLETLHFFMHMHDERYSPELSVYLVDQLNKECGLNIPRPQLLNGPEIDFKG